jgi:hypothetical protein
VTIGLEIVFLTTADVGTEHFSVVGAIIAAFVGFIIPFVYTRRNTSLWGYIELARLFDGPKFSGGSKKLRSKYEEGQEVSEEDLRIAAEQVRSELIVVMGMIGTGLAKKKRVFGEHSDVIVKTIDSYRKYLAEFEPELYHGEDEPVFSEFEIPIKKCYNTAQQWLKEGKLVMSVMD